MDITLKPEQEQFIQEKLQSGKYQTANEVIVEAFRLLEERDKRYQEWLEETRQKVAIGLAELERGEGVDGEVVMAELRDMIHQVRENHA
ncbi:type II toxin-antitoxin system ParD family antitoxin [Brunnivagina elsteri]|uniref:Type II toxin-antitoxin system ParD family antitoxin n=1 Tax=Brunnivagina elsteri CCALA 953 TaxID=987040 RepID=A0A2A2T9N4_9CYAN|nr:type II toxin-antitoxin system ParD family antitoxin [Calothrix elsteri]PAX45713.1 type II toxin-antitoxin system ParD family antitoxin [Calothrix elsteri CCALA 953]